MRAGAVGFAGVVIDTRLGARFRGVVAADSAWPVPRRECRDWGKRPRERAHPRRHHRPLGFAEANRPPSGRLPPQTEPTTPDFSNQHHLADFLPREKKGTRKSRRRRSAHLPSTLSDRSRPGLLFVRSRLSYSGDGSERRSVHPPAATATTGWSSRRAKPRGGKFTANFTAAPWRNVFFTWRPPPLPLAHGSPMTRRPRRGDVTNCEPLGAPSKAPSRRGVRPKHLQRSR